MNNKLIDKLNALGNELSTVSLTKINDTKLGFLSIEDYQVKLKNGAIFNRQKLLKSGKTRNAVVIVALTKDNKTYVIVEPRVFTKTGYSIEVPAGYVDDFETEASSAARELKEELGCVASTLIPLKSYYQDQGTSGAINTCFLALDCVKRYPQKLDKDEFIKYQKCSINNLYYLVDNGIISDANSIIAINETRAYLNRKKRKENNYE